MARGQALNVTFVIPYFYPALQYGGQPRSAYDLARALVNRGHHVKVLTTDSGGSTRISAGRRNVDGIDVVYYRNLSNWLAFRQRIFWPAGMSGEQTKELRGCDIVHIHELRSTVSVIAYRAAVKLRVPYVLSPHGGLRHLGERSLKTAFDAIWGTRLLRDAAAVIAISPIEEADAKFMQVPEQRIERLPNMIVPSEFEDLPQKDSFRSRWRLDASKMILFLARLHPIKGADLLIRSFRTLAAANPDARLVIAGPDDGQESQLRDMVRRFGLNDSILFTGFLDHKTKLEALVDADILAVPSRSEVFAITAIESLMCGCPVVLSDACGLYPLPQAEHGVSLFESESADDLATKLSAAINDSSRAIAARSGREFVMREFSADRIAERAESIYRQVLRGARHPVC